MDNKRRIGEIKKKIIETKMIESSLFSLGALTEEGLLDDYFVGLKSFLYDELKDMLQIKEIKIPRCLQIDGNSIPFDLIVYSDESGAIKMFEDDFCDIFYEHPENIDLLYEFFVNESLDAKKKLSDCHCNFDDEYLKNS